MRWVTAVVEPSVGIQLVPWLLARASHVTGVPERPSYLGVLKWESSSRFSSLSFFGRSV